MKLLNCVLLFFLISISTTYGKDIYIDYNASKDCMDSYEYAKDGNNETPYLFFHLKVSDNEKVILEAGEDYTPRQYKPSNTLSCRDLERDEQFVSDVNAGLIDVFVVQEHTYGFRIYKVKKAEYYYNTSIAFGSRANDYSYAYYYNQNSTGNLATKGSKADVFFDAKNDENCLSEYNFRVSSDAGKRSKSSITILPEIGVLYKKADPVPPMANGSELELRKINDYNIQDYLGLICKFYGGKPNTATANNNNNTNNGRPNTSGQTGNSSTSGTPPTSTNAGTGTYYPPYNGSGSNTSGTTYPSSGGISVTGARPGSGISNWVNSGMGTVYLDVDKGFYINSKTGQRAEGEFGGNIYRNGYMVGDITGPTSTTTTTSETTTTYTPRPTTTTPVDDSGCLEASTADTHIVRKKETLFGIARVYGLSVQQLKKWNKISSNNRIYPCMRLSITAPVQTPAKGISSDCDEQPTYNTHVVQKQETLFSIAKNYGITVNQIKAWNGLRRNTIYPCTRLAITAPVDYQYNNRPTAQPVTGTQPTIAYIIQQPQGGTIAPIGANAPTAYDYVGGKGGKTHTVKKGETLYKIASLYGMKVQELININKLSSNMIAPGQVLIITGVVSGGIPVIAVPQEYIYINPALSATAAGNRQATKPEPILSGKGDGLVEVNVNGQKRLVHVVREDESLAGIARYYNTSVAKLRELNDMDRNEVIVPFQRLYVE